jgi:hypothetical protein
MHININPKFTDLPFARLNIKVHKNPVKFRTLICGSTAITKNASKVLGFCLKLCQTKIDLLSAMFRRNSNGLNWNWIISSNKPILECISHLNSSSEPKTVNTFDFTELYTSLRHDRIKTSISELIDLCFSNSQGRGISVTNYRASWAYTSRTGQFIDQNMLKTLLSWVLDNAFFSFGKITMRQIVGIPMGTDAGPQIANLFLLSQERKFILANTSVNPRICRDLKYTFRYIDDITAFSDNGSLGNEFRNIYDDSLSLVKVNTTDQQADVLDITISVGQNRFTTKLYDKRRDFAFKTVSFPCVHGNLSKNMCYNTATAQIHRYGEICSQHEDFIFNCAQLLNFLTERGYKKPELKDCFFKSCSKYKLIARYPNASPDDTWVEIISKIRSHFR